MEQINYHKNFALNPENPFELEHQICFAMYEYECATDCCGEYNWERLVKKIIKLIDKFKNEKKSI